MEKNHFTEEIINSYSVDKNFYEGHLKSLLFDESYWEESSNITTLKYGSLKDCLTLECFTPTGKISSKSPSISFEIGIIPVTPMINVSKANNFSKPIYARDNHVLNVAYNHLSNIQIYRLKYKQKIESVLRKLVERVQELPPAERKKLIGSSISGIKLSQFDNLKHRQVFENFPISSFEYLENLVVDSSNQFLRVIQKHFLDVQQETTGNDYFDKVNAMIEAEKFEGKFFNDIKMLFNSFDYLEDAVDSQMGQRIMKELNISGTILINLLESVSSYNPDFNNIVNYLTSSRMKEFSIKNHMILNQYRLRSLLDEYKAIVEEDILPQTMIEELSVDILRTLKYTQSIIGKEAVSDFNNGLEPYQVETIISIFKQSIEDNLFDILSKEDINLFLEKSENKLSSCKKRNISNKNKSIKK